MCGACQENAHEFSASRGYIARPCLKRKRQRDRKEREEESKTGKSFGVSVFEAGGRWLRETRQLFFSTINF